MFEVLVVQAGEATAVVYGVTDYYHRGKSEAVGADYLRQMAQFPPPDSLIRPGEMMADRYWCFRRIVHKKFVLYLFSNTGGKKNAHC